MESDSIAIKMIRDLEIDKEKKRINFKSGRKIFGTHGKTNQTFGELPYRMGIFITTCKTHDPECLIEGEVAKMTCGTVVDSDLNVIKRSSNFNHQEFCICESIVSYLREIWSSNFDNGLPFDSKNFFDTVSRITQPDLHKDLVLDDEWSSMISNERNFPLKGVGGLKPYLGEGMTFQEYRSLYDGDSDIKTVVHIPMLVVEKGEPDIPDIKYFPVPEAKIAQKIGDTKVVITRSYDELEIDSFLRCGRKQSLTKKQPDIVHIRHFTQTELKMLANRGVLGKENDKMKDKRSKKLSFDCDLSIIDDYLNSRIDMIGKIDDKDKYLLKKSLNESTNFIKKHIVGLCKTEFYQPLRFLDAVMAEVAINNKRNPSSRGEFIIRKINGYKAYVIIKNTRFGSVNDPAPSFYSIVFRGRSYNSSGVFEEVVPLGNGWSCTRFLSTDRTRSSHTMNLWEQFMSIVWENMECLSTLTESFNEEILSVISRSIKYDLLALLSDSTEFSSAVSNLRFYYFPLLSGLKGCKRESERMIKKFPTTIRSPLLMHCIRNVMMIHETLDEDNLIEEARHLTPRRMVEAIMRERDEENRHSSDYGAEDLESDSLPTIPTPFGYNITNTRTFLKSSFKQIYHNKDESDKGPAAKQIVSKIFKTEKRMRDALRKNRKLILRSEDLNVDEDIYQCNFNAMIYGADLIRVDLINESGQGIKEDLISNRTIYDVWMREKIIMPTIIRTTYAELATSRSSFINNGDVSIRGVMKEKEEVDELDIGKTKKCIEVLHEYLKNPNIESHGPAGDLQFLLKEFVDKDEGRIVVKIFKKDQNTGVRDIYILTIQGRMLIRICEDISRSICKNLVNEKLTSPWSKDKFMSEHYLKVKTYMRENSISSDDGFISYTFKESGDMSEWANRWFMKSISVTILRLIPKEFHPLIMKVLNSVTDKHIELPRQFIKSCMKNPETVLDNEMANVIKRELIGSGENNQFVTNGGTRVTCYANMMQGILHYTSSLAHTSSIRLFCHIMTSTIKRMKEGNVHCVMSYECSSDDKGVMMTVISKKESMPRLELLKRLWKSTSNKVDRAFGIKTSDEKTNLTVTSLFEFNNVFYCGNSISTALAKFTARCLDDSVQASLHQRVSGFYSSLRQVRENGGSGVLCSLLSYAQRSVLMNNLGWRSMEWFDNEVMDMICEYKFSFLGNRNVSTPITAGICMTEYENMKEAYENNSYSQLMNLSRNEFSDDEFVSRDTMDFGIWERSKHENLLKNLKLSRNDEMSREDLRIKLTGGNNKEEMQRFIEYTLTSKAFGRSLAMVQRSDLTRASVYLLWSQTFLMDGKRSSIYDVVEKLKKIESEKGDYPEEYLRWFLLEKSNRVYSIRTTRSRLRPRKYDPLLNVSVTRDEVVSVIKREWYGYESDDLEDYDRIKSCVLEYPWIKQSEEETFEKISPSNFLVLLNSIPNKFNKVKLLARGPSHSGDTIEVLMRENCCADMTMAVQDRDRTDDYMNDMNVVNAMSHRLNGWCDVLHSDSMDSMTERCLLDLKRHSELLRLDQPCLCGTYEDNKLAIIMNGIKMGEIDLVKLFNLNNRRDMWIRSPWFKNGEECGIGIIMKYWRGRILIIFKEDGKVTRVSCDDIIICEEMAKLLKCDNFDNAFPSLKITPKYVRVQLESIVIGDDKFETIGVMGTSRINAPNFFDRSNVLDDFLRSDTEGMPIDELIEDNEMTEGIAEALWNYHIKRSRDTILPSVDSEIELFPKRRYRLEKDGVEDLVDDDDFDMFEFCNDLLDAEDQEPDDPMDFNITTDFDFQEANGLPDWTIAGTETARLRNNTGWERNEGVRFVLQIFSMMKKDKSRKAFSEEMKALYRKCSDLYNQYY